MQLIQNLRSLFRDRLNTVVIIISLAVGVACINLITTFIIREFRTDSFHKNSGQIYALKCDDPWMPGRKMYHCRYGSAEFMKNNFDQVEDFCRISNANAQKIIVGNETYFDHPSIIAASENFFRFFSYRLLTNNPETALESKNNIAISSDLAAKYFGTENPLGKIIILDNRDSREEMVVTGIFQKPVDNTQINFEMVRPAKDIDSRCYLMIAKSANQEEIEKLFLENKETIPNINTGKASQYYLEPLRKAYFDTSRGSSVELSRDRRDLVVAFLTGLIIIGIAVFNYFGILTNRYYRKIKEYYIRRINGGSILNLITHFMMENSVIVLISFLLGTFLMFDILPFFNNVTESSISSKFILQPEQILLLTSIFVLLLLFTFLFAAFLIRSNLDFHLLKTEQNLKVRSIHIPLLNIFQLAGSVALITCSLIIIRQMNYITGKPIGLNKSVIEIKIPPSYRDKAITFKNELLRNSAVKSVSVVGASPVLEHFLVALKYQQDGVEKQYSPSGFSGDENYLDVLDIELVAGTGFSESLSGNTNKCLINESFARLFQDRDLIGRGMPGMENMIIQGIVKDFHYSDLKSSIEPAFISYDNKGGHLLVRANENQSQQVLSAVGSIWKEIIPDYPVNTESVGDRFEWFHRKNTSLKRLIGSCALISLFLSMIGLFAISYQKTRSRTKEIGIRKINGANTYRILTMMNRDFVRWTLIAFVLSVPAAWYAMHKWLETYAYKTQLEWWIFVLAGLLALVTALLTVSFQTYTAAIKNPVESLRYE
jgi:putative ABC transport system permease protein